MQLDNFLFFKKPSTRLTDVCNIYTLFKTIKGRKSSTSNLIKSIREKILNLNQGD